MKPNSQMKLDRYFRQCVGIDVSKDKFTACLFMYDMASDVGCCTESVDFPNSKTGFNQMVKWSRKEAQKGFLLTYLMEPTGSYYEPLAYHLHKIGLTLYVVLPNKARSFCEYEGIKTKTDAMDARCLALLGCKNQRLRPWQPPKAIYRELRQLTRLRASLTKMQTQIMNHIEAIDHMESVTLEVCKSYKKLLSTIQKQLEQNEQAIADVNYVGLSDNPYHELAQQQFGPTAGAMLTIDLASKEACFKFLNRLKLIHRATNLFDSRTLAIHPASTIFGLFPDRQLEQMDVRQTTIRLSVGLEAPEDILADIQQATKQ
jgi:hypothetical protein